MICQKYFNYFLSNNFKVRMPLITPESSILRFTTQCSNMILICEIQPQSWLSITLPFPPSL